MNYNFQLFPFKQAMFPIAVGLGKCAAFFMSVSKQFYVTAMVGRKATGMRAKYGKIIYAHENNVKENFKIWHEKY